MYFDDIYMEDIRPATQVNEYVAKIIEFCLQDSHISEEVEKGKATQKRKNYAPEKRIVQTSINYRKVLFFKR